MRKLVKRNEAERDAVVAFTAYTVICDCTGNCQCPVAPSHQIGIGVREQKKDSAGDRELHNQK